MGSKCARCCRLVRRAYPLSNWDAIVAQKGASPEFALELEKAIQIYEGMAEKHFLPEKFEDMDDMGFRVETGYRLLTEQDVNELAGGDGPKIPLRDLKGIQVDEIVNE